MEIFATSMNPIKPKYYNSHRSRQSSKKVFENDYVDNTNVQKTLSNGKKNILEIGFGTGNSIKDLYQKDKQNYFCIESYELGVNNLYKFIKKNNIENIHVYQGNAIEIIEDNFNDNVMDEILIFFPDPWPKTKHRKRRILNTFSIELFFSKLKNNGTFHFATDHIEYAYSMKDLISNYTNKKVFFSNNRRFRPITSYELRGIKRKNFIFDIILKK